MFNFKPVIVYAFYGTFEKILFVQWIPFDDGNLPLKEINVKVFPYDTNLIPILITAPLNSSQQSQIIIKEELNNFENASIQISLGNDIGLSEPSGLFELIIIDVSPPVDNSTVPSQVNIFR